MKRLRLHWHKVLILYLMCLGFLAGKIQVWEPVGKSRKDVWRISISKDTSIQYKYGTHYFAVIGYPMIKTSGQTDNLLSKLLHREKRKELTGETITRVWINGSEVWGGKGGIQDIAVDGEGNWLMTVWLGENMGAEVWLNGVRVGRYDVAYLIPALGFDQLVWKKEEEKQQCLMDMEDVMTCVKKIVAEKWTYSGIFWVEKSEKEWRVHTPEGKVRSVVEPEGKEITPHLDDFGKLWWIADYNLYSEDQPRVPVLSKKEGWRPAWIWPYYWDMYQRLLPSTRRGVLLKRNERKSKIRFLWNRTHPLSRDYNPFSLESLVNAEYAIPCGKEVKIIPMRFAPIRSRGFLPGHIWLLGSTEKGDWAMFFDCSREKGLRFEIPLPSSRNVFIATPIWLGREPSLFYYLRILIPGGFAGYPNAVLDCYRDQDGVFWTLKSLDDKVQVSDIVWVMGPPYWLGAWHWKQVQEEVRVSWEISPLFGIKETKEGGKQATR